MFGRKFFKSRKAFRESLIMSAMRTASPMIEPLEDRRLLSASVHHTHAAAHHAAKHTHATKAASVSASMLRASSTSTSKSSSSTAGSTTTANSASSSSTPDSDNERVLLDTIEFGQAPSAVQSGLKSLAASDSLAVPTSTQTVYLANLNGIETYSLVYTSTGTATRITVDQNGKNVTPPAESTITWATLSGSGTGSNAAAAAEISKIVTALALTAPTSTTMVNVSTVSNGTVTYGVRLGSASSSSSTSSDRADGETIVSVDSNGNPVGRQELPFSVLPTAIQNGFNAHLPPGAAALSSTSTQTVDVLTANGKTFYSTAFNVSGTTTTVTVDATGALATLPSTSTTTYSALETSDAAAAMELQKLATANGAGTIGGGEAITVYDEGNGTKIYSVSLTATNSTTSQTLTLTISVDQSGNPTVPPSQGRGERGAGGSGGSSDGETDASGDFGGRGHWF